MEVVLVVQMRGERELCRPLERPLPGRLGTCTDARAPVEERARRRPPQRRRLDGRRGGTDEIVGERRYVSSTDRIRPAIASTLGRIASSSDGLYEMSRSSRRLSACGRAMGTPRIVSSEITLAPQPPG